MTMQLGDVFILTVTIFVIVGIIDTKVERAEPKSWKEYIDSALFSSYHRRFTTYFVSFLVLPIGIIFCTLPDFWSAPLPFIGVYLLSIVVALIISVARAGNRDRRLNSVGNRDRWPRKLSD